MFVTMSEWMELSIPIISQEDVVQIDIDVNTIVEHLFDLNLQIGYIEEVSLGVTKFELKNTVENLRFLSIHMKNSDQLNMTEIYGSLIIHGNSQLSLKNITLEIIQKGRRIAIGRLSTMAYENLLNKTFGSSGVLNVSNMILFELTNHQIITLINMNMDGPIIFHVRVISSENEEITADYLTPIKLLIHSTNNNNHTEINNYILPSFQKFLTYQNDPHQMKGCISPQHETSHKNDNRSSSGYD
jgi:hypothetical protein